MKKKKYKTDFKILGNIGEELAVKFLEKNEYKIINRNFTCNYGEIDIIALKDKEIIFFEVKTRRNSKFGEPVDAVNMVKREHIWNSAKYYLYKNNLSNYPVRFDVIEVYISHEKAWINHLENVSLFE